MHLKGNFDATNSEVLSKSHQSYNSFYGICQMNSLYSKMMIVGRMYDFDSPLLIKSLQQILSDSIIAKDFVLH